MGCRSRKEQRRQVGCGSEWMVGSTALAHPVFPSPSAAAEHSGKQPGLMEILAGKRTQWCFIKVTSQTLQYPALLDRRRKGDFV